MVVAVPLECYFGSYLEKWQKKVHCVVGLTIGLGIRYGMDAAGTVDEVPSSKRIM